MSSDETSLHKERTYINKLNMVLVQVELKNGNRAISKLGNVTRRVLLDIEAGLAEKLAIFHPWDCGIQQV